MSSNYIINKSYVKVFALSEISISISRMIQHNYNNPYWITAEIAKLNYYSNSGHCFLELAEKSNNKILAQMQSTIWRDDFNYINTKFIETTKEQLTEGQNIMFLAYIKYSGEYGLSLQIIDIEPSYTIGIMALEKVESVKKLKELSVFNNNKLIKFPILPQRLAIISTKLSKGYNDFLVTISNNSYNYKYHLTLFEAYVQGDKAVSTIIKQLEQLEQKINNFDLVIIIRGGSNEVGLSCYDNFDLAFKIATFPIPIITGIGHSTNETVAEMVAAANKITPTEVAYFLINIFNTIETKLLNSFKFIKDYNNNLIKNSENTINHHAKSFIIIANEKINKSKNSLELNAQKLSKHTYNFVFNNSLALIHYENAISKNSFNLIKKLNLKLNSYKNNLHNALQTLFIKVNMYININNEKAKLLDPKNILKRGYSITRVNGKAIKSYSKPISNDNNIIETQLYKGKIYSKIINKNGK